MVILIFRHTLLRLHHSPFASHAVQCALNIDDKQDTQGIQNAALIALNLTATNCNPPHYSGLRYKITCQHFPISKPVLPHIRRPYITYFPWGKFHKYTHLSTTHSFLSKQFVSNNILPQGIITDYDCSIRTQIQQTYFTSEYN